MQLIEATLAREDLDNHETSTLIHRKVELQQKQGQSQDVIEMLEQLTDQRSVLNYVMGRLNRAKTQAEEQPGL